MPNPTSGLSAAATALRYYERRQEVVANNLANASTDGFKAERVFAQLLEGTGASAPVANAATDLRAGTLRETGGALDLAIEREGFLVVSTPNGERLSRGGTMRLDAAHRLVTADGHPLLGAKGAIVLTAAEAAEATRDGLQVGADGTVRAGARIVDVLRMETSPPGASLAHEGASLLVPADTRAPLAANARTLRQGALEESNVDALGAMVDMIAVQRAYASVQKAVTTLDEVRGTAASDLGRPV